MSLKEKPEDLLQALQRAEKSQRELDRQLFHLSTLYELSKELGSLIQPKKMLDSFLLMAMGTLGFSRGFALLLHNPSQQCEMVARGLSPEEVENIQDQVPALSSRYVPSGVISPPYVRLVESDTLQQKTPFPARIKMVFQWAVNSSYSGLFGFGGRLSEEFHPREDIDFVLNLANNLITALNRTLSEENIRLLNTELLKRTETLEQSLEQVRTTKDELARRVFHLNTMYECVKELTGIVEVRQTMDTFLLTAMGIFSVNQGCILVYDSGSGQFVSSARGVDLDPFQARPEMVQELFYTCFSSLKSRKNLPLTVQPVQQTDVFDSYGFPMQVRTAFMFAVDEQCLGLLCFGQNIFGDTLEQDELELFDALITNFSTFLKNARAFEIIRNLNTDLTRKNVQLKATIDELTAAKNKIVLLENAKNRIRSLIQSEAEKIGRVSRFDIALILLISLVVGLLFNFSNPHGVSVLPHAMTHTLPPTINLQAAQQDFQAGEAMFVDARPAEFYSQSHIPGAVNLPPSLFDFVYSMRLSTVDPDRKIILYGRTFSKRYDQEVSSALLNRGHNNVWILSAGLSGWRENRLPVEPQE